MIFASVAKVCPKYFLTNFGKKRKTLDFEAKNGGKGGIRTHETVARLHAFQAQTIGMINNENQRYS